MAARVCWLGWSESLDGRAAVGPWWAEPERKCGRPERNLRAHCSVGAASRSRRVRHGSELGHGEGKSSTGTSVWAGPEAWLEVTGQRANDAPQPRSFDE